MYAGVLRVKVVNVYPAVEPGMRSHSDTVRNCGTSFVEQRGGHSFKPKCGAHVGHVIQPGRRIDAVRSEFSVGMSEEESCNRSSIGL